MWPHAFIAGLKRRVGYAFPASTASCQPESAAISGTVQPMPMQPLRDGTQQLERRATVYYNRDPKKVALYLAKHQALAKGNSSYE